MKYQDSLRVRIIRQILEINEYIFVTRRVFNFYNKTFGKSLDSVIDVGGNKGQSIELFLKINPDVNIYSFEPNPTLYEWLLKKYSDKPNVKIFNLAISNFNGRKKFYESVLHSTSSLEELNQSSKYLKKKATVLGFKTDQMVKSTYEVNVITLASFIKQNMIGTVDIIKLDTEGHEYSCLEGLFNGLEKNVKCIQIEVHDDDLYKSSSNKERAEDFLENNGYMLSKSIRHGFGKIFERIYSKK